VAQIKRNNRKAEFALQKCEALSAADLLTGGSYDQAGLDYAWRKVLHNQFHDILPGSSLREVYDGTDKDYAMVADYCAKLTEAKLKSIGSRLNTQGGTLVYNPLGFARCGSISVNGQTLELTTPIPAMGWQVIQPAAPECNVTISGLTAKNRHYVLQLNEAGQIVSLFDKAANREVFKSPGNTFTAYEDLPYRYDNWEISDYYRAKAYPLTQPATITPVTDGSRAGFRVEKQYQKNTIVQYIWLWSHSRRIDFDHEIQWHQHHQFLKLAFPLDIHTTEATYEIQYGHVRRPTHQNTSWDAAKFEVCGHKWVDMSENGYGVALLNDCKYGYSVDGATLELSVLKAGTYPTDRVDHGLHVFSCALIPHSGSLYNARVIREAYSFNQPLEALAVSFGTGDLPEAFSMLACDCENIIVESVKKAQADEGMIVRLYDSFDRRSNATITVTPGFRKAYLCDLMENVLCELPFDGRSLQVPVKNFEIITVKFTK
jgi:alpha-mannosidase